MQPIEERDILCPYCWQPFAISVEPALGHQRFVEDCPVCCAPVQVEVVSDEAEGGYHLNAWRADGSD